jgi:hypothetical protein
MLTTNRSGAAAASRAAMRGAAGAAVLEVSTPQTLSTVTESLRIRNG